MQNGLPATDVSQEYSGVRMEIPGSNWQGLEFPKLEWRRSGGELHLYLPQSLTEIQHALPWRVQGTNLLSVQSTYDFVTNGNHRYFPPTCLCRSCKVIIMLLTTLQSQPVYMCTNKEMHI